MSRALAVFGPTAVTVTAFTGTSTAAVDMGEFTVRVLVQATEACYVLFGESNVGAATSSHWPLNADVPYVFDVTPSTRYFRVISAGTNGNLVWGICA